MPAADDADPLAAPETVAAASAVPSDVGDTASPAPHCETRRRIWRSVALTSFAGLAVYLLFGMGGIDFGPWKATWTHFADASHQPFGFICTGLLIALLPRGRLAPATRLLAIGFSVIVMLIVVEIVQPYFSRSESLDDALFGIAGVVFACWLARAWSHARNPQRRRRRVALWGLAFATSLTVCYLPAWRDINVVWWQTHRLPVLGDFEDRRDLALWFGQGGPPDLGAWMLTRDRDHAMEGDYALAIPERTGNWPGIFFRAGDHDWTPYSAILLETDNPGAPFTLAVRIDDATDRVLPGTRTTRYQTELLVPSGRASLRIPFATLRGSGGQPDLSAVRRVVLFRGNDETLPAFYLDHVRLEPTTLATPVAARVSPDAAP